jgi:hypothetical protein
MPQAAIEARDLVKHPELADRIESELDKVTLAQVGEKVTRLPDPRARQSADRKAAIHEANRKAIAPKPRPKAKATNAPARAAAKAKVVKAPGVPVERVPAAEVLALLKELGMSKTQLAQAVGVSGSLVAEHTGKGRGQLLARARWPEYEKKARAWAKKALK